MNPTKAEYLPIGSLRPFQGHPFQVKDDDEMEQLVWSILSQGVLTPLVVRPMESGEYEVISGHRRLHACKKAGIETVPALIYSLDRDAAAIALVDSNLYRERILPSEKAFAYKLKMNALSHQGTSCQLGTKLRTDEVIGSDAGESARQVQRYIRLTNLIPEILHMVDEGRIALTPAVELSYLTEPEQRDLLETMESEDCTPSISQAQQLRRLSQSGKLTMDAIFALLTVPKANQREKVSFYVDELRGFFPRHYTAAQIQKSIVDMLRRSRGGREDR